MSGYDQSGYGGTNAYGQGYGYPTLGGGPFEQPSSIRTAVMLMRIGALLSLFSLVVAFLDLDGLHDTKKASTGVGDTMSSQAADNAFALTILLLVIVGLCRVGLWLWMASANGRGRSWARVVASIFFAIHVLSTLGDLPEAQPAFSFVTLALGAVIVVLLWQKESSAYYDGVTATQRRG